MGSIHYFWLSMTVALVALLGWNRVEGSRILMIPHMNTSHFNQFEFLGVKLADRGHEINVLLPVGVFLTKSDKRFKVLHYGKNNPNEVEGLGDSHTGLAAIRDLTKLVCIEMMTDKALVPKLLELKFDLAIVDNFFESCFFVLPYRLGVPYVALGTSVSLWSARLPILSSVTDFLVGPEMYGATWCIDEDAIPRIGVKFCRLLTHFMNEWIFIFTEADLRPYVDFDYPPIPVLRSRSALVLGCVSPLLGSVYPKLPHVEYVGGITAKPGKPLNDDLQKWFDESPIVVIVSFGTRFTQLPNGGNEKLLAAFSKVNARFFVRFNTTAYRGVQLPSNVRLSDWLPQNDALAHPNTRIFITHSGMNGLLETLYHGVPLLSFPLDADQFGNAKRVGKLGYGLSVNPLTFEPEEVVSKLNELLTNPSYTQRIKKASAVFHSEKHPAERAADAVEHVLRFGSDHLVPKEALELSFWEFYSLDVLLFIYFILFAITIGLIKALLFIVRRVTRRDAKRKVE